ncbi:sigma factor-like helix-turn-helix DNA-binding protein [Aneurinibacillus migulanus]|uniref:sigma factor-like helix-turn-helix DNA-binding protein n=1 Tax=Aneurinibacillus migulanus TaxID=47500 RepID=UPI00209FB0A4|nr:sigma factor-like helix-turn-helix DNA-binding protein [Aneurinibacillus migulanus]MCP1354644.1 RNA polymerase subunit sigma [Aneurinibacillus migulanus]
MGTCAVDIEKGSREYTVKYALDSADGVKRLMTDLHRLRSARFERGDYAASDILIDLDSAIIAANLTIRQRQAVYYVYEEDMRHEDVAKMLDISRRAIGFHVNAGISKIATVFSSWGYGEITAIYVEETEINENTNEEGNG